jgi:hypothetical protein
MIQCVIVVDIATTEIEVAVEVPTIDGVCWDGWPKSVAEHAYRSGKILEATAKFG